MYFENRNMNRPAQSLVVFFCFKIMATKTSKEGSDAFSARTQQNNFT